MKKTIKNEKKSKTKSLNGWKKNGENVKNSRKRDMGFKKWYMMQKAIDLRWMLYEEENEEGKTKVNRK